MLKRTLSGLLFCALSGALVAHGQQFVEAPQYPTGTNPQAVAVGDFNGDGKLDLAVVNTTSNTISVLLGKGDGTFNLKVDYATGSMPQRVAVGDFNGDGHLDLAVTNSGSNTVSVLLGNSDGTFQAKLDSATGSGPQGLAVGDFNGDGHLDIVVTNFLAGNVGVLLGNGKGTFGAEVTYNTPSGPYAIAVGDFNNDGVLDFAVANRNINTSLISVFLGNGSAGVGNGTFQTQMQYAVPTGDAPVAIVLADFNGDGNLDIAVAEQGNPGNAVSILLGNGKGAFTSHVEYATGATPTAVTVGDFNGDGTLDLAVSVGNGNAITVLWGMGDGTFQGQLNLGTGDIPYSVAAGDFNGDGKTDLVATNSGGNTVSVILNNGNYTFQARTDYPVGPTPYSVATADFNGDGITDIAVANSNCPVFPACGPGTISIVLGIGDGTFQAPSHYSTGTDTDPYSVVVGDFNGDKIPDLAVANYATNTVSVMLGVGDGTFLTHTDFPVGSEPDSVATGDFNGDGKLDLAVTNFHSNTVSVLLGNGDGTFKSAVNYNVGHGPISVAVADFNGDHNLDLVVVNETDNNASILLGNGDGTFKTQVAYPTVGGNPLSVVVGDFNGDGIPDLAVADYQNQEVSVLLGNGDGTFQSVKVYPTGANPSSIVIADFNGDGKLDLALTSTPLGSSPGNLVSLLLGNGDGTFRAPALFGAGYLSYSAAVGDFNGDGTPDLAVANGASDTVSVLLNTQGTAMSITSSGNPSAFGQSVAFTTTVSASVSSGTAAPTGTVTLKNGSGVIGSGALANGQFSLSTSTLPVGTNAISAIYSGDSNYQPHTIGLSQTVQMAGSSTVLASSANPSNLNQSITFTATVTSDTTGVPTGTVAFWDGTNPIGSSAVNSSGVATLPTSTLAVGSHNITAAYGGDSNFNASTSPVLIQVVQQGNASTALTSSANPSIESQSVTFTATVSSGTATTPTGSVKFMDGTTPLGTSTLNLSGVATVSTATLSVGTHNITAVYGGDSNFSPSTSPVLSQVVQQSNTNTALTSSANPSIESQSVTLTATVNSGAGPTPTGSVKFLDGTTPLGTSTLNASGIATLSTATLSVGNHNITAVYGGDTNSDPSTSPVLSQVVQKANTSVALISSANPSNFDQSVTFTATVSSVASGTPTGTMTLLSGTNPLGSSALNASGVAILSITTLPVGADSITAVYSGDANFSTSTSTALSQVVDKASTSTALSSNPTAANLNQAVTFTATVTPGTSGSPTGMATFLDGTTPLGTSALNSSGVATFSTSALAAGSHNITATYNGDGNYNSSSSTVVTLVVTGPDFSLSAGTLAPSSIAPGKSAQSTITISPVGGLDPTTVVLKCSVAPAATPAATCSLGSITVANTVGTAMLTFTAAGPQTALATPAGDHGSGMRLALGLMIPAMLLGGAGLNKPGRRKLLGFCLVFLVLSGCLLQVACGASGGGNNTPPPTGNSGTPAGTYTVTVTGTANGTQHTAAPVSLTVQ